jgi:NADPH:quinone reductase-like Zn-dependent oxidoreductase
MNSIENTAEGRVMQASRIHDFNTAPVLDEVRIPDIGPGEVLVRVKAVSLNPLDVLLLSGKRREVFPLPFPYTLGTDLAGTVEHAGPLAARWRPGDRVAARLDPVKGGALADFAVVPAADAVAVPAGMTLEEAAGVPTAAGAAWQALFEMAKVKRGQTVLIHAGAGGVGSFALQLARIAGAKVIATASGSGLELARQLGAEQVIDYRTEDFAKKLSGVDVVIDPIGGETQLRSYSVLRPGGVLIATAAPPDEAIARAHEVKAARVFHKSDGSRLGLLFGLCEAGLLKVLVDRELLRVALEDALRYQGSGRAHGKIILAVH